MDVVYDLGKIQLRPRDFDGRPKTIWRYSELLPVVNEQNIIDLHVGFTPLVRAVNLGHELGQRHVYVKNDTVNPTFSFKDRPAGVAVSKAVEFGDSVVCAVSTGNLAGAVAAHAAKAGLRSYILTPSDTESAKIAQVLAYGARVIQIDGTYDDANRLAIQASDEFGWNVVNVTSRSYYVEGSKTIAFELCEQFGWTPPDNVIIPVASGALLRAIAVGFRQFREIGLIEKIPRIFGSQAEGCEPVARAFREGENSVRPVEFPTTIAKSIAIGDPGDGKYVLEVVRETGGAVESASDKEILKGIFDLARLEGVFAEPAGAVTVAVAKKLREAGRISRDESTVLCVTGNGLKTSELVLGSDEVSKPTVIRPSIDQLKHVVSQEVSIHV